MKVNLVLFVLGLGAASQLARGQLVRGSLIDSPPPANALATNGAPLKQGAHAESSASAVAPEIKGGYLMMGFDKLAGFWVNVKYVPVKSDPPSPIQSFAQALDSPLPENIKALESKKVAVKGFLLPLKVEAGLTTEFVLLRNQSLCCYGKPPQVNEWVHVRMNGKGIKAIMDQPTTIFGTLHVGEFRENKQLLGLYQMEGDKMEGPENSR